jgi:hypothetical protein
MTTPSTIFLAGIIQGSRPDSIEPQDYRGPVIEVLSAVYPDAELYDPVAVHPDSLNFEEEAARTVFFDLMRRAGEADLLVAYLPAASMGTAIEIWNAYHAGTPVVVIGPLGLNWVVRFCADKVCESLNDFVAFCEDGGLAKLVEGKAAEA